VSGAQDPAVSRRDVRLRDIRRRFLILSALRWLPAGLLIPVLTLLLIERGFTVTEIGVVLSVQGLTVFVLELPTGGLADSLGRRPVLLFATALDAAALIVLLVADSIGPYVVVALLMGVYRALESGPLDAWAVDALHEIDDDADVESMLGSSGTVTGIVIAAGALASAGLVASDPFDSVDVLVLPVMIAVVGRLADVIGIAVLMRERRPRSGNAEIIASVREVPTVIRNTLGAVRSSRVLAALIAVEFFWGFGMVTFETFVPIRIAEVADGTARAASIFGPAVTVAWLISAAGAWLGPKLAQRAGTAATAMMLHAVQAASVVGMAVVAGPLGVVGLYLATMGTHGALNPLYKALLHRQASPANRTTVLSAASMAGFPGFAVGGVLLGLVADASSITAAMVAGAIALLCTIPLYVPAHRQGSDAHRDAAKHDGESVSA
jgi:predicted MFS family arabinose efflux permease